MLLLFVQWIDGGMELKQTFGWPCDEAVGWMLRELLWLFVYDADGEWFGVHWLNDWLLWFTMDVS